MAGNEFGVERYGANYLRCHPITGPLLRRLFQGTGGLLFLGIGVTVLLLFNTGNPLNSLADSKLWRMAVILSPYIGWFLAAWFFIGGGLWRGFVFLAGALLITAYGLYHMADAWFLMPRPVDPRLLLIFPLKQWAALAGALIVAIIPGLVFGAAMSRALKSPADNDGGPMAKSTGRTGRE